MRTLPAALLLATLALPVLAEDAPPLAAPQTPVEQKQMEKPKEAEQTKEAQAKGEPPRLDQVESSAFFTPVEMEKITNEVDRAFAKSDKQHDTIQLDALLYFGKDRWKIWLNGEALTPTTRRKDLRVASVTPTAVTLILSAPEGERKATLRLHESTPRPRRGGF